MIYLKSKILQAIGYQSYSEFCAKVGISKFNFSKWVNKHQNLSVATLYKILNYLEVLSPEHNFSSIEKLTTNQLLDIYENRDKLEEIFKALEKLDNDYKIPKFLPKEK